MKSSPNSITEKVVKTLHLSHKALVITVCKLLIAVVICASSLFPFRDKEAAYKHLVDFSIFFRPQSQIETLNDIILD